MGADTLVCTLKIASLVAGAQVMSLVPQAVITGTPQAEATYNMVSSVDFDFPKSFFTKVECNDVVIGYGRLLAYFRLGADPASHLKLIDFSFFSEASSALALIASRHKSKLPSDHYALILHKLSFDQELCPENVVRLSLEHQSSGWKDFGWYGVASPEVDKSPVIHFINPSVFDSSVSDGVFRVGCRHFLGINPSSTIEVRVGSIGGIVTNVQYVSPDSFDATVRMNLTVTQSGFVAILITARTGDQVVVAPATNIQILRQKPMKLLLINTSIIYQSAQPRCVKASFEDIPDTNVVVFCGLLQVNPGSIFVTSSSVMFSLPSQLRVGKLDCSLMTSFQSISISLVVIEDPFTSPKCTLQNHVISGHQGGVIAALQFIRFKNYIRHPKYMQLTPT